MHAAEKFVVCGFIQTTDIREHKLWNASQHLTDNVGKIEKSQPKKLHQILLFAKDLSAVSLQSRI